MNDVLKWVLKIVFHMVLWVFILSVKWDGRPMFSYANEVLVQNALVRTLDEEAGDLWYRLSKTAKATFSRNAPDEEKPM